MPLGCGHPPDICNGDIPVAHIASRAGNPAAREIRVFPKRSFELDDARVSTFLLPGRGRPVLFIHGNSSCKEIWSYQIELVKHHARPVLAPDLPGHGQSSDARRPADTYSFPGYAAVIGGLLDELGWRSVDIVGWSLGGHIGLEMLATDQRVNKLLIVGTPPVRPSPKALSEGFHTSDEMQLVGKQRFTRDDACTYASQMLGGAHFLSPVLLKNTIRTDGNARFHMLNNALAGVGADACRVAETAQKPICVVHGEHEPFVRLNYLRSVRYGSLWNGKVFVIQSAGHAPHWQTPSAFNDILSEFLDLEPGRNGYRPNNSFALASSPHTKS
ncbi:MAG: alpha/beta hydrolase [Hyphomicrobiaceae bacterium]|nr:alpha/beta hydrolase [Hyphomicrobiaceae bacterium]